MTVAKDRATRDGGQRQPVSDVSKGRLKMTPKTAFAAVPARIYTLSLTSLQIQLLELFYLLADGDGVVRRSMQDVRDLLGWKKERLRKTRKSLQSSWKLIEKHEKGWRLRPVDPYFLQAWHQDGKDLLPPDRAAWAKVPLAQILDGRFGGAARRLLGWYRVVEGRESGCSSWKIKTVAKALDLGEQAIKRGRRLLKALGYVLSEQRGWGWKATTWVMSVASLTVEQALAPFRRKNPDGEEVERKSGKNRYPVGGQKAAKIDPPITRSTKQDLSLCFSIANSDFLTRMRAREAAKKLLRQIRGILPKHKNDDLELALCRLEKLQETESNKAIIAKVWSYKNRARYFLPLQTFLGPTWKSWDTVVAKPQVAPVKPSQNGSQKPSKAFEPTKRRIDPELNRKAYTLWATDPEKAKATFRSIGDDTEEERLFGELLTHYWRQYDRGELKLCSVGDS